MASPSRDRPALLSREPGGRWRVAAALAVFAWLLAVWGLHFDTPFARVFGFADWIGNQNGRIAANHLRYGLGGTLGLQIMNLEPVADPADRVVYRGHPGTLDLLVAGVFALTGSQAPWAHRLLPLLAALIGFGVLWRLARCEGLDPWLVCGAFAAFPIIGVHGINLSYEPLALAAMLGLVLAWRKGARWSLVPGLWLGGLIDYPVLYLAPVFAFAKLRERRGSGWRRALLFAAAVHLAGVAAIATHLGHLALALGDLEGNQGLPWADKISSVVFSSELMPNAGEFFAVQARFLLEMYSPAGCLAALVALVLVRLRAGAVAGAFLFAGLLHIGVFRWHACRHDFWSWYLAPAMAWLLALAVERLPRSRGVGGAIAILLVAVTGARGVWRIWHVERAGVPVREVARDLSTLFSPDQVLHQMRGPPGWAVETYRGHPVFEAADLLTQAHVGHDVRYYLDLVGGTWGLLGRPQLAYLYEPGAQPQDASVVERFFPGAFVGTKVGRRARYRVYDIAPFLFEPSRSPELLRLLGEERCRILASRARMFLVLPRVPAGGRLIWVDGGRGAWERFRGRAVRRGDEIDVVSWRAERGIWIGAPAGGEGARSIRTALGGRVRWAEVATPFGRERCPLVAPR